MSDMSDLSGDLLEDGPGQPVPTLGGLKLVLQLCGVQHTARDVLLQVCSGETSAVQEFSNL